MKAAEALHYLENYGGQAAVPALYTDMPREMLAALAKECERPSADARASAMLDALTQPRRRVPEKTRTKDDEAEPAAVPPEARVQAEVERRLLEMSASAGHRASPPADELSSPSNDLEPAGRTSPARAGARDDGRDDGRDHVPMSGAFPPRRREEMQDEIELTESERDEMERYAINVA